MDVLDFNINNLVRENIRKLSPYSSARDEYTADGNDMVFLDANENPFETSLNRYPDPQQRSLKKIIANNKNIEASQLLLGNGSDEVLDLLFRAFCEPNIDNIITLPPTYGMYDVLANINAVENKKVILTDGFQPNVEKIIEVINKRTKLLFLCSPNNPTGNSFKIESIIQLLNTFKGLVIIDEAYIDFSEQKSWIERLNKYPNLVITQTFSKAYGLAGIRLGICFANEKIISILNRIKPPYNINELTQREAYKRLSEPKKIKQEISEILEERIQLIQKLETISFVEKVYPTDTNFVLIKVDNANKRYNELLDNGIVIRNRTTQALCENTLRLTVGTKEENKKLINVLTNL